jgi:hypothetical protein
MWTLADAGSDSGGVLRLAPDRVRLWRTCGSVAGTWLADTTGLFVADIHEASGCDLPPEATPDWLRRTVTFRVDGDGAVLLDERGGRTARLRPGGKPAQDPNLDSSEAQPPTVTDQARQRFAPSAPLPARLRAVVRDDLTGRWQPAEGNGGGPKPPFLEFTADGGWRGSDGCNGTGGRWVSGAGGTLLATSGPTTLMLCPGVPVGGWLNDTRRAGLDGDDLVLVGGDGEPVGRLRREGP